jgi:hypothetical protein
MVGVDDLAREISLNASDQPSIGSKEAGVGIPDLKEIRMALIGKTNDPNKPFTFPSASGKRVVSPEDIKAVIDRVADGIFEHYRKTWTGAFEREKSEDRWKTYSLFAIGGGCRIPNIALALRKKPWDRIRQINQRRLMFIDDIEIDGKKDEALFDEFSDLLPIAYGLSFHKAEFPDFILPGNVRPFRPSAPRKNIPDYDHSQYK